jgi:hypothetical protein
VTAGDPVQRLRDFVDERWAVIRNTERFRPCSELHDRLGEVTPREAEWFLHAVTRHGAEPPLFTIDDANKHRSDRYPPNASGSPRGNVFFEKAGETCSLRLETIVHQAATWRLHTEFGWPRDHLVIESPDVAEEDGKPLLRREALDILVLEDPCPELPSRMTLEAARSRVGVEAKADERGLARLIERIRECQQGRISPDDPRHADDHKKCNAIHVLRPRFFLGVAAAETWRVFDVIDRDGRASLGEELPSPECLRAGFV